MLKQRTIRSDLLICSGVVAVGDGGEGGGRWRVPGLATDGGGEAEANEVLVYITDLIFL